MIRQTSRSSATVEYSLIPMPQTYMSLHRDIAEANDRRGIDVDDELGTARGVTGTIPRAVPLVWMNVVKVLRSNGEGPWPLVACA